MIFATEHQLFLDFATGVRWHAAGQIRFVKFRAIDVNRAIFQENRITADADNAFDCKTFG